MEKIDHVCIDCQKNFTITRTNKKASNGSWVRFYDNDRRFFGNRCYPCHRTYREKIRKPHDQRKYEKTKKGFVVRVYRNMKSRIDGVQKEKAHLYAGKEILGKKEFYIWSLRQNVFHILFSAWEKSGYDRKLTPSIDRIDSSLGYIPSNMQWITHSENSRKGSLSRWRKID